ncbi:MAG: response regulator [Pseudomonadota bacterium]|nr:response regulator [Pseudomonadota bacterium]
MSQKKGVNTAELVQKIERITREKVARDGIVSLDSFRKVAKKERPKTLLVIEDDETMREAMRRIFESDGYKVLPAADGTQLSHVLNDAPIDMIILDVGLPWINGYELAQLLKEHKDLKRIPLIFVSGKTNELDIKRGFQVGCDDYIKKPFEVDKIKKTVNTLLKLAK